MRWTINAGSAEEGATCLSSRPPKTQPASLTTSAYQTAEFNIAKAPPVASILPALGFYTVPCLPDRRTLPTYPVSSREHGLHRDSGMGSGTWWAALAKAKCQRFVPPPPGGAAFLIGDSIPVGHMWELVLAPPEGDLPTPTVTLFFLCYPPSHLARSSQLGPPMSGTSQSPWGPWGPTLAAVWTSLLPGRTSLVPPVTAAPASHPRAGRHRLLPTWLVSLHPTLLPSWPFGRWQGLYPDPLGQVLCLRANVRVT